MELSETEKDIIKYYRRKQAMEHVDERADEQVDIDDITPEKVNDPAFLAKTLKAIQRATPKE